MRLVWKMKEMRMKKVWRMRRRKMQAKRMRKGWTRWGAFRKWLEVGNELGFLSVLWSEGWEEGSFLLLGWRCRTKSALAMAGRARFFRQGAECAGVYS